LVVRRPGRAATGRALLIRGRTGWMTSAEMAAEDHEQQQRRALRAEFLAESGRAR